MAKAKKAAAKKAPAAPKASPAPKSKALPTGDIKPPDHVFRVDMGEALPPQAPPPTATDKGK